MRLGKYEIKGEGTYYTVCRIAVTQKGKHKGEEVKLDTRHFHGIDKVKRYLTGLAIDEGLEAATVLSELEESTLQAVERLFGANGQLERELHHTRKAAEIEARRGDQLKKQLFELAEAVGPLIDYVNTGNPPDGGEQEAAEQAVDRALECTK